MKLIIAQTLNIRLLPWVAKPKMLNYFFLAEFGVLPTLRVLLTEIVNKSRMVVFPQA